MSSDPWIQIQEIKNKRNTLREKLEKRKRERQEILNLSVTIDASSLSLSKINVSVTKDHEKSRCSTPDISQRKDCTSREDNIVLADAGVEKELLSYLSQVSLSLPVNSEELANVLCKSVKKNVTVSCVNNLLQKFSIQNLISIANVSGRNAVEVITAEHSKILGIFNELCYEENSENKLLAKRKNVICDDSPNKLPRTVKGYRRIIRKEIRDLEITSLLTKPSIREKETKKISEEILDLLSKPTAKEKSLADRFKSQGSQLMEFCPHKTKADCDKISPEVCTKLHFKKIIQCHTDESLGDCSFLNTCFHIDTCRFVHYEVDGMLNSHPKDLVPKLESGNQNNTLHCSIQETTILHPPQWIQCDLRYLDWTILGKFSIIMADPPWDIHMELPYGTLSDDEMRHLPIPVLQDEGLLFLWVTGRAMELGRECLKLWGYKRVEEIIWVKTNQLQRIIRTGRTGHWLNHGKEHCLVGMKGDPKNLNRGLDCDVLTAEVRATSHKPDEIYGIIERLSPGTRKVELFGRSHNVQPNWLTLGNQVNGIKLVEPDLIEAFQKKYPDGNCMQDLKT